MPHRFLYRNDVIDAMVFRMSPLPVRLILLHEVNLVHGGVLIVPLPVRYILLHAVLPTSGNLIRPNQPKNSAAHIIL
jgi:hypothetical protein